MLIAHGPIGYLTTHVTKKYWNGFNFSKKQVTGLYVIGFVAGMLPDIDLFFYYFINASYSHRQLITHSLLIHLVVFLIGLLITRFTKFKFIGTAITLAGLAMLLHVLADCLVGMAVILAPLSNQLYGLVSISWFRDSFFMRFSHITNFGAEFLFIFLAGYIWIKVKHRAFLLAYKIIAISLIIIGLGLLMNVATKLTVSFIIRIWIMMEL